jgi:hypothetical protein
LVSSLKKNLNSKKFDIGGKNEEEETKTKCVFGQEIKSFRKEKMRGKRSFKPI